MKASIAYIVAPLTAYLFAHIIKYILSKPTLRSWRTFFRSGSMPSSHTAVVTALAVVIFVNEGFSELLAVVAIFSSIVIFDSLVARRSIGEQGRALVRLIERSPFAKDPLPRVALGHTPTEVAAGLALGIIIGFIVAFFITK